MMIIQTGKRPNELLIEHAGRRMIIIAVGFSSNHCLHVYTDTPAVVKAGNYPAMSEHTEIKGNWFLIKQPSTYFAGYMEGDGI